MKNSSPILLTLLLFFSCQQENSSVENTAEQWWTEADRKLIISELNRTTEALKEEIKDLTEAQWNFREDSVRWSIGEIVEHLEMQNQLHYREIGAVSNAPQYLAFRTITKGQDAHFTNYATDTTRSQAKWFLEPLGRFPTRLAGINAFLRARGELTKWVTNTGIDLRKQFTFRTPVTGKAIFEVEIGEVRDLHQLLLTGIAHTDRHLQQIKNIKKHPDF